MMDIITKNVVFVIVILSVLKLATSTAAPVDTLAGDDKSRSINSDYQAWKNYKIFRGKVKGFRNQQQYQDQAPSPSFELPPGWLDSLLKLSEWLQKLFNVLFPPMNNAPSQAPSPSSELSPGWWDVFFPWVLPFPPSNAPSQPPSPSFEIPPGWWEIIFPWFWLFPPMSNAPSPSPAQSPSTIDFGCC